MLLRLERLPIFLYFSALSYSLFPVMIPHVHAHWGNQDCLRLFKKLVSDTEFFVTFKDFTANIFFRCQRFRNDLWNEFSSSSKFSSCTTMSHIKIFYFSHFTSFFFSHVSALCNNFCNIFCQYLIIVSA